MKIAIVLGTRPELVKMASILEALDKSGIETNLIHTGQHYDKKMSGDFFQDLNLRSPDFTLGIGSGNQVWQTAECMLRLEKVLETSKSDFMLVQGDTNAVLAGALTAVKMNIPVGHIEAGLRSNDRRMPEEYNRRIADHISHLLFAPTEEAAKLLRSENVWGDIVVTGNTVIDACEKFLPWALEKSTITDTLRFDDYILVTAHRAENVDNPKILRDIVEILTNAPLPIVYPIHPRAHRRLVENRLYDKIANSKNVQLLEPTGYLDFLSLMKHCRFILTDSGGIQEEATSPSIKKRVLVLRDNTERPEAVTAGFSTVVGTEPEKVLSILNKEEKSNITLSSPTPYGNGNAGVKITEEVLKYLKG